MPGQNRSVLHGGCAAVIGRVRDSKAVKSCMCINWKVCPCRGDANAALIAGLKQAGVKHKQRPVLLLWQTSCCGLPIPEPIDSGLVALAGFLCSQLALQDPHAYIHLV